MKRVFISMIFAVVAFVASAQDVASTAQPAATNTTAEQVVSIPKTDWITPFDKVKVDGPMNVVFKKVATPEENRITYDTKGNISSKFKFEIDKKGMLIVSEKYDPKRTSVTDITIYYNKLREVKISHARAEFEEVVENDLFDLVVSGGAMVSLDIKTLDSAIECTGVSRLTLGGSTKYLTLRASTAKLDCTKLSVVSATVDASHSAELRMTITERLEATTSTGAKLLYKGTPTILRDHTVIFGGEIININ